jgi:hypothetical protein
MSKPILDFGYILSLASRNANYNTVTALCEPIDNADDPNVKAKMVDISFGKDADGKINTIYIADNGASMTKDATNKFWSIAKTSRYDENSSSLGKFNIGGKAGALSMGDELTLITKRQGGQIYSSTKSIDDYTPEGEPERVTDQETISLFEEKIGGAPHGTLVIISNLIDDYRITEEEFLKKDDFEWNLRLIYSGMLNKIKHSISGNVLTPIDIMGGIDESTGKRVMAKIYTSNCKIFVEDCPVPMTLITFHRYRNSTDTVKWDVNDWGLFIIRNGRVATIEPLKDSVLFGERGRSHRQMEFGAILKTEPIHDKYLNMPYSKFIEKTKKFNADLLSKLSEQLKRDCGLSTEDFAKEGEALSSSSMKEKGKKIAGNLNKLLQGFKRTAKYKKTTGDDTSSTKPHEKKPKDDKPINNKKTSKKVKFVKEVNFGSFGEKSNLIDIYYEGNNSWIVNVNVSHPLYNSMSLNEKKLECMIYYELALSMAIDNVAYTHDEKSYRRLDNNRRELHDIQETFIHEMSAKYVVNEEDDFDKDKFMEEHPNCQGINVSSEELELELTTAAR